MSHWGWHELIQSGISAGAGLLGVAIGGWMTSRHQKKERQNARYREQLLEFYAPLRGIRTEIRAKSELRVKLQAIAGSEWTEKFGRVTDPTIKAEIDRSDWPKFEAIINFSNEQLRLELVPMYRRMLKHFRSHMGLAELSTIQHFPALVEFVELWNRHLESPLPAEVAVAVDHSEANLKALYDDIDRHFEDLARRLG